MNLWFSSIHTCSQGEKEEVITFRKEWNFCGYSKYSKSYRIYILGSRQIEVSRDVTFEEEMVVRHGDQL